MIILLQNKLQSSPFFYPDNKLFHLTDLLVRRAST